MVREAPRVLIVDDDVDITCNVHDILTDLGYVADVAHDGLEALQLIQRRSYAVALVDLKMPGMDGATLYGHIKSVRPETVTILITGFTREPAVQQAIDAGTWKVLSKPVDIEVLLGLLRQALSEPLVILVDDDSEFCESLWQLLREQGYRVAVAHREDEGVAKAREAEFQIALADWRLGDGDGREVLAAVRARNPGARTMLITGHRSEASESSRLCADGVVDAVSYKPIDPSELLSTLEQFLHFERRFR
ncbi:MAG: response regulator [Pirellulales bacterium]